MGRDIALHVGRDYQRQWHIGRHLEPLGFKLHKAPTVPAAKKLSRNNRYRLVLMHFDTVGRGIFEFCSFIRSRDTYAILIALMANVRIDVEEELFGYGVNDVVTGEQTSSRVLTKRIRAHLLHNKQPPLSQANTIRLKDTIVDFDRREVWCNGTIRRLRGILPDLLKYFLNNPNRIISRDELLKCPIWADSICSSAEDGSKTFDVNVSKLRKLIESDSSRPQIIISVRGEGWILAEDAVV